MGKKSPKPASPTATANAQTETNKETAWYNAMLQNMNQITPYGNLTYTNNGNKNNPQWTSKIELSPEQKALYDKTVASDNALAQLGYEQIGRIRDSVSNPYSYEGLPEVYGADDLSNFATNAENAIYSRLDPKFAQEEEALRTRLINQGIGQGSQAYQRELDAFNQAKNDARTQAVLAGQQYGTGMLNNSLAARNQAIQEYNTQRNAPLNEYSAITSGTQVQNPTFSGAGNTGTQPVDIAGLINNAYNQRQAAANNMQSNIFGLGGSFLGAAGAAGGISNLFAGLSDYRLKENIEYIGTENGWPVYEFNYINIPDHRFIGVMAQDVERIMPEAVSESEGFKRVNYDMIGVRMREAGNG